MKHVQIFIDESGSLDKAKPMNISGVVLVGSKGMKPFHDRVFHDLGRAGLSAGVCDLRDSDEVQFDNLSKRAEEASGWDEHWDRVERAVRQIDTVAKDCEVELAAISLRFPSNTKSPWRAKDPGIAKVIDRPYDARLQDLLELTLFDLPLVVNAMNEPSGCLISVNLPTRTSATTANNEGHRVNLAGNLRKNWGKDPWDGDGSEPELLCNVLEPADGIEILTSVLNRREKSLPENVTFERCCCCKLMDWEKWSRYSQRRRENYARFQIAPKQVHYAADFLANAVFQNADRLLDSDVLRNWFERGFRLDTRVGGAESWIEASRRFENRDRVGALKALMKDNKVFQDEMTTRFFRQISNGWGGDLSNGDFDALFRESTSDRVIAEPRVREKAVAGLITMPNREVNSPVAVDTLVGTTLDLPTRRSEVFPAAFVPGVRWRVAIYLPGIWTPRMLLAELEPSDGVPIPVALRSFASEKGIEFLLDLRTSDEVMSWTSHPVKIGDLEVEARDATLPKQHRIGAHVDERVSQ